MNLQIVHLTKEKNEYFDQTAQTRFHYGKKHSHFHARDKNSFLAFKRILKELEREISKYSERNKLRLKSRTVLLENLAS
jgi:ribosome-associated translation inhibitor RaiA